jgi:hypothetical protein
MGLNSKLKVKHDKALTYIEERNMERIFGRSLSVESDARALQWGKMCEGLVFEQLSLEYDMKSQETIMHPTISCWAGSSDARKYENGKKKSIGEIKCPVTLKSFFSLTAPLLAGLTGIDAIYAIRDGFTLHGRQFSKHPKGEDYFYQMVSNAINEEVDEAELIVFVPYLSQLQTIRDEAEFQGINWIKYATDDELPYILDGGVFANITKIPFKIPQKDIDEVTAQVLESEKLLIPRPSGLLFTPTDGAIIVEGL